MLDLMIGPLAMLGMAGLLAQPGYAAIAVWWLIRGIRRRAALGVRGLVRMAIPTIAAPLYLLAIQFEPGPADALLALSSAELPEEGGGPAFVLYLNFVFAAGGLMFLCQLVALGCAWRPFRSSARAAEPSPRTATA